MSLGDYRFKCYLPLQKRNKLVAGMSSAHPQLKNASTRQALGNGQLPLLLVETLAFGQELWKYSRGTELCLTRPGVVFCNSLPSDERLTRIAHYSALTRTGQLQQ